MATLGARPMDQWAGRQPHEPSHDTEVSHFRRLIHQSTADGWLARQDEDRILAALIQGSADSTHSTEKCALFRQLQERVWRAELYLEPR